MKPWCLLLSIALVGCNGDPTPPVDSMADDDGDGVPDALEIGGFVATADGFAAWDNDPDTPHFFTDPTAFSTDGDPYGDGMEASGIGMDPTVAFPGNHPLVPALPNIVVVIDGYTVTPESTITLTDGTALLAGSSSEETTARTTSRTLESSWEVGSSVTVEAEAGVTWLGTPRGGVSVTASAYYEETNSDALADGTSTARRSSSAAGQATAWSRAVTQDPSRAARVALKVRILNRGSATATNITPTFTLAIGERPVATFDPPTDVVSLRPGETWPASGNWVLDTVGLNPIYLTLDELRLLQTGAPLSLQVNQIEADLVVPNGIDWEEAEGDWDVYTTFIAPTAARLVADDGQGGTAEALVYAEANPNLPPTRLIDAAALAFGLAPGGNGTATVTMVDANGRSYPVEVGGWRVAFDTDTWASVGDRFLQGENPFELQLTPDMTVRLLPLPAADASAIHYAEWHDLGTNQRTLRVAASDAEFTASSLDVRAEIPGVGTVTLQHNNDGLFESGPIDLATGTLIGTRTAVQVRNPEQLAQDATPLELEIGTSVPLADNRGAAFEIPPFGTSSPTLDFGTLTFDGPNAGGVTLRANESNETWYLTVADSASDGGWCVLGSDQQGLDITGSDLDGCAWESLAGSLFFPAEVLALRVRAGAGAGPADRLLIIDFRDPPSGAGFNSPSDVRVRFSAYAYRYPIN